MPPAETSRATGAPDDVSDAIGHPRGTLAIVLIFGLLFALGWLAMYLLRFAEQGMPHH